MCLRIRNQKGGKDNEKNTKESTMPEVIAKSDNGTSQAGNTKAKQKSDDVLIVENSEELNSSETEPNNDPQPTTAGEPAILTFDSNFKW